MYTTEDINVRHTATLVPVQTSMHGIVDKVRKDLVIKVPLRLYGAWTNLSVLFPTAVLNPVVGRRIFGTSDLPLVIHSNNGAAAGDKITYHNAQLTKLANLFLGINAPVFAADVEFTCLLANNTLPTAAAAYFTILHNQAFTYATFPKSSFRQEYYTAAWGAVAGFTSFQSIGGWNVEWDFGLEPEIIDSLGTVDMILQNFLGRARCAPLEPTMDNIAAAAKLQDTGGGPGTLLSASSADLAITGASGGVITLKTAGMTEHGFQWGMKPLRNGEVAWETTVGFSGGTALARSTVA